MAGMTPMTPGRYLAAFFATAFLVVAVNCLLDLPHRMALNPVLAWPSLAIGAIIGYVIFAFADFADGRPRLAGAITGGVIQFLIILATPAVQY
jgi:hypothetical protein